MPNVNFRERGVLLALRVSDLASSAPDDAPRAIAIWNEDVALRLRARGLLEIVEDVSLPSGLVWCRLTAAGREIAGRL